MKITRTLLHDPEITFDADQIPTVSIFTLEERIWTEIINGDLALWLAEHGKQGMKLTIALTEPVEQIACLDEIPF
jgi:hypothetical protein